MFELTLALFWISLIALTVHIVTEAKSWIMYTSFSSDEAIAILEEWQLPSSMTWLDRISAAALTISLLCAALLLPMNITAGTTALFATILALILSQK